MDTKIDSDTRKKQTADLLKTASFDYAILKKRLLHKVAHKEYIITEECVTSNVLDRWRQLHRPSMKPQKIKRQLNKHNR